MCCRSALCLSSQLRHLLEFKSADLCDFAVVHGGARKQVTRGFQAPFLASFLASFLFVALFLERPRWLSREGLQLAEQLGFVAAPETGDADDERAEHDVEYGACRSELQRAMCNVQPGYVQRAGACAQQAACAIASVRDSSTPPPPHVDKCAARTGAFWRGPRQARGREGGKQALNLQASRFCSGCCRPPWPRQPDDGCCC